MKLDKKCIKRGYHRWAKTQEAADADISRCIDCDKRLAEIKKG
jgi:hypothetical protein